MSKMNQVIQIGKMEGNIHYYIEDYAYTFLKKQEGKERKKYFLYGEKEETEGKIKLYIYGIGQKPKMEQTYFKEYYPLGYLKIKEQEKYWISLSGEEQPITGAYIFYAPNQAMQEYLVDYHKEEKVEEKVEDNVKKRFPPEMLPMKETKIAQTKWRKKKNAGMEDKLGYPIIGLLMVLLLFFTLSSVNGRNKIALFKQVIQETMSDSVNIMSEEEFTIEEKTVSQTQTEPIESKEQGEMTDNLMPEEIKEGTTIIEVKEEYQEGQVETDVEEMKEKDTEKQEEVYTEEMIEEKISEQQYEEYIVKNGDTLVGICKKRYRSLSKMEEICEINNIKNADYIAPGQKLYLP